nr:AbrB/MazE/SpoVT family DNA-binding domain-containing protein [uncultured Nitrososphaera sp.]
MTNNKFVGFFAASQVSSNGHLVLPVSVIRQHGIEKGDRLLFYNQAQFLESDFDDDHTLYVALQKKAEMTE